MTYPAYDPGTPCAKCGEVGASTVYKPYAAGTMIYNPLNGMFITGKPDERLQRDCFRCGYRWNEAVITPNGGMKESITLHGKVPGPVLSDLERDPDQDSHRQI